MPVTREYECPQHKYFTVQRAISAPTKEVCPRCGQTANQVHTAAPLFGFKGNGIPNSTKDASEYEGWQKATMAKWQQELNVANAGTKPRTFKELTQKTGTGKKR